MNPLKGEAKHQVYPPPRLVAITRAESAFGGSLVFILEYQNR